MTTSDTGSGYEAGPPTADDLRAVHFTPASMLHPGYTDREVDAVLARAADGLAQLSDENGRLARENVQLAEENARLRAQVQELQEQVDAVAARPSPSDQAVGILATAQLTADEYVAEAEDFSRQMTSEARAQYEEQLTAAREKAGAIIQAAQEAGAAIRGNGVPVVSGGQPESEELQEQVAYLKAFSQACRVQLRSYLEALLSDVETEWGRAHPGALPTPPRGTRPQQLERGRPDVAFAANATADDTEPAGAVPASRPSS
ncbi:MULTISPECIES: DivIVA domain-containing protein [unclassified Modestobacter]|uniref:DivIVA domain-containing protein n=1 Tax=unclassified Modestobacter TaxID=2643866 RepID=UPI0022AA5DB5|nr:MULTISPECIES: DivIVA domain-containing protein [unclassified Modestobacter]MCZ2826292.1 DivIVA domain-containing protein [Modestobacter sp. VKM Ac-2981]MCZ2852643.1 DivIVA domain-containing protein [Modestobacter sp. VKM Ac-2982]